MVPDKQVMPMPKQLAAAALAALLLSMLTMAVLLSVAPSGWSGWQPASCLVGRCFCEAADPLRAVQQPVNSVSSLVFLFPGCAILWLGRTLRRSERRFSPAYAAIVGSSALVTGVGSAFYHASLTFAGQFWDILGMLLLAGFILVYALERSLNWPTRRTLAVYAAASACFTLIQVLLPDTRRYLFAVVLLVALLLEYRLHLTHQTSARLAWLNTGVALFALAFGIWILDQSGWLCQPTSLLQGHALWHVLGAAGVGLLYGYYRSEKPALIG